MRCRQKVIEMDCPEFSVPPLTLPLSVFLSDKDPRDHIFPFLILIFNFICLGGGVVHLSAVALEGQKRALDPQELELLGIGGCKLHDLSVGN